MEPIPQSWDEVFADIRENLSTALSNNSTEPTQSLRRSRRLNRSGVPEATLPASGPPPQAAAAAVAASTAPTATTSSTRPTVSRHYSTWVSQNRQMERQRSFYTNYYANRIRNTVANAGSNAARANSNSDSQPSTPPDTSLPPIRRSRSESTGLGSSEVNTLPLHRTITVGIVRSPPSTLENTLDETEIGEAEPVFNNAATQTNISATVRAAVADVMALNAASVLSNSTETRPTAERRDRPTISVPTRAIPPAFVPSLVISPFHEYLQHLGAYISIGRTNPAIVISDHNAVVNGTFGNNGTENANGETDQLHEAVEQLNFEALFGLNDSYFNNGLSKQEINRHTISYEYKVSSPVKRKRMKTEDGEAVSPAQTSCATTDGCSICLDKLNPNVVVRRLPCLHVFHIKCIDKWLKQNKKCPICRIAININYDTLCQALESGSSIDQCLSQQESSSRQTFRPTITLQLQGNGLASLSSITLGPTSSNASTSSRSLE